MIRKQLRTIVIGLASMAMLITVPTSANAQSVPTGPIDVVALGDSYISGVGAGNIDPNSGACMRSANAFPELIAGRLASSGTLGNFSNVTCSGATTKDVRATQLSAVTADTDLILLTAGGNDAGLPQYGGACVTPDAPDCSKALTAAVLSRMPVVAHNIKTLLRDITATAPNAKVVVIGYGEIIDAKVVSSTSDPLCQQLSQNERRSGWMVENALDAALRVGTARAGGNTIYMSPYASPFTIRPEFASHSLCDTDAQWYNGFNVLPDTSAILHPTADWHAAVAAMLRTSIY